VALAVEVARPSLAQVASSLGTVERPTWAAVASSAAVAPAWVTKAFQTRSDTEAARLPSAISAPAGEAAAVG
jgi:hypothetical protein